MENPTDKLIRELRDENEKLKKMLSGEDPCIILYIYINLLYIDLSGADPGSIWS